MAKGPQASLEVYHRVPIFSSASNMDKSLEDIIKSKKIKPNFQRKQGQGNRTNGSVIKNRITPRKPFVPQTYNQMPQKRKVMDARQKIIAKTRSTVVDARSKITQKDARLKLLSNQSKREMKPRDLRGKLSSRRPTPALKQIGIIQRTVRGDDDFLAPAPLRIPLQRTIHNNFTPRYESSVLRQPILTQLDMDWSDMDSPMHDPIIRSVPHHSYHAKEDLYHSQMDLHATRTVRNDLMRESSPPSHHEILSSRGILGGSRNSGILTRESPRLGGSAGVLSASSRHAAPAPQPQAQEGHRIVVSNLKDSVNSADIKELFEDIGPLLASRVVRPGTAEVIYARQRDAVKAVETYHNRQLDKQPMKCMLVTPRATTNPLVPAAPKLPSSSKPNTVQPDLAAVYKALFNKPSQVYK